MVLARIAKLPRGGDRRSDQYRNCGSETLTQDQAAAMLNVSVDSGQRAKRVIEKGVPEVAAAVDAGKVKVSAAAEFVKQPLAEQKKIEERGAPFGAPP